MADFNVFVLGGWEFAEGLADEAGFVDVGDRVEFVDCLLNF